MSTNPVIERASVYVETHKVFELFERLVQDLVVQQPANPIQFVIDSLKRPRIVTVIIAGGPGSGKGTQCERIVKELGCVHVSTGDIMREAVKRGTPLGKQVAEYQSKGLLVPDDVVNKIVLERLRQDDCRDKGWLLDGYPRTPQQAEVLRDNGLIPDKFISIECPDEVMIERVCGRRLDPVTGQTYHVQFRPAPENDKELQQRLVVRPDDTEEKVRGRIGLYRRHAAAIAGFYQAMSRTFDGTRSMDEISQDVIDFCRQQPESRAPRRAPRIMVLGPPGAGKSVQSRLVADKFHCVTVNAEEVLHAATKRPVGLGKEARSFLDANEPLPDDLMSRIFAERLARPDCKERGWLLDGYPRTEAQARSLAEVGGISPSVTVVLEIDADTAVSRLASRRIDPISGKVYHPEINPATADVAPRLVQRDSDREDVIRAGCSAFAKEAPGIREYLAVNGNVFRVDCAGNKSQQTVCEEVQDLLGRCVRAAP